MTSEERTLAGISGAAWGSTGTGSGAGLEPPKLGKPPKLPQPARLSARHMAAAGAGPKLNLPMASPPSSAPVAAATNHAKADRQQLRSHCSSFRVNRRQPYGPVRDPLCDCRIYAKSGQQDAAKARRIWGKPPASGLKSLRARRLGICRRDLVGELVAEVGADIVDHCGHLGVGQQITERRHAVASPHDEGERKAGGCEPGVTGERRIGTRPDG